MKKLFFALLPLLTLLALMAGGCTPSSPASVQEIDAVFTLKTAMKDGRMVFVGADGEIDGAVNPDLVARQGDTLQITLINDDGMSHDLAIPDLYAQTSMLTAKGQTTELVIEINGAGEYVYYCTVAGHRQAGMEGKLVLLPTQE
jgi:nitrite reductase (NO-forming)